MKKMLFCALSSLAALLLSAASTDAGQRVLDLSTAPGSKVSLTATQGEVVTFKVINRLPGKAYTLTVEERVIPIPPFEKPAELLGQPPGSDCTSVLHDAESLEKAADEAAVGTIVRKVNTALAAGTCTLPAQVDKIKEWLAKTTVIVPGAFVAHSGVEIILTALRDEKIWTMVVSGGERGQWLTTYGVSIVPSKDERYFLKPVGDKFKVTAEQEVDDLRMIPSVYFSWLPRKRMLGDFAFGPTAGLGLSKSKPAVFAGFGLTYNWNLAFIGGLAVSPHTVLNGRYKADDELSETVADDQLNREVYKPTWVVAVTFRFAGNPFGGGDDKKASLASGDQRPDNLLRIRGLPTAPGREPPSRGRRGSDDRPATPSAR